MPASASPCPTRCGNAACAAEGAGLNAIRCSHNAPPTELLDACDRLGMLVMDENRKFNPAPDYMAQLEWLVRRDRNRPSVILWSVFNEEPMQGTDAGLRDGPPHGRGGEGAGRQPPGHRGDERRHVHARERQSRRSTWSGSITSIDRIRPLPRRLSRHAADQLGGHQRLHDPRRICRPTRPRNIMATYDDEGAPGATHTRGMEGDRRAAVRRRRVRLDRFRLSRRADAVRMAVAAQLLRHHGHVRLPQDRFLAAPGAVDRTTGPCSHSCRTGTGRAARASRSG